MAHQTFGEFTDGECMSAGGRKLTLAHLDKVDSSWLAKLLIDGTEVMPYSGLSVYPRQEWHMAARTPVAMQIHVQEDILGKGGFATVKRGKFCGGDVAVKLIEAKMKKQRQDIVLELDALECLRGKPEVVQLHGARSC